MWPLLDAATGVKRRKVTQTVINDKGEEVTEEIWEEEPGSSPPVDERADESQDGGSQHSHLPTICGSF